MAVRAVRMEKVADRRVLSTRNAAWIRRNRNWVGLPPVNVFVQPFSKGSQSCRSVIFHRARHDLIDDPIRFPGREVLRYVAAWDVEAGEIAIAGHHDFAYMLFLRLSYKFGSIEN